ncbi:MAG: hypothetical protein ABI702_02215 [Burkholderiales bacterium]
MDQVLALASQVRAHYLRALLASYVDFEAAHAQSATEVMFELQRDEPLPFRLHRADMAAGVDGKADVQEVNPSTHLSFEPFEVEVSEGITVAMHPIVWNDVGLRSNTRLPLEETEAWALRWLDLEDRHPEDEQGLQGVIHSVSREDAPDGSTLLEVDFGSSPVQALSELLELAFASGASHVSIHSSTLDEAH